MHKFSSSHHVKKLHTIEPVFKVYSYVSSQIIDDKFTLLFFELESFLVLRHFFSFLFLLTYNKLQELAAQSMLVDCFSTKD